MSTTHLISDDSRLPYTIVGKKREDRKLTIPPLLSLVVLNRGGRPYRNDYFRELERIGNFEIISVEGQERSFDVEALSARYPQVCFLLLHQRVSAGEAVNLGMKEAQGRLVLVLWNDMLPGPFPKGSFHEYCPRNGFVRFLISNHQSSKRFLPLPRLPFIATGSRRFPWCRAPMLFPLSSPSITVASTNGNVSSCLEGTMP